VAIVWHAIVSLPMVTVAALMKLAGLAHILGTAPQTEASALPQQADAAAHAAIFIAVEFTGTASHAAASLAAAPRCWPQYMLKDWHDIDESPMVTEAVLTKSALLAHTLGAAPQAESAPPQQAGATAHAIFWIVVVEPEETAAHFCASLAASIASAVLPPETLQSWPTLLHVKVESPVVALAALLKSASLAHIVALVPAASATTRRRILGMAGDERSWPQH